LAFVLVAYLFLAGPPVVTSALFQMNVALYKRLHLLPDVRVPKDYYTQEYFAFFLPAIASAGCLWGLLRLCRRKSITNVLLRSVAGIIALAAAPAWWLCFMYSNSLKDEWITLAAGPLFEVALVLALAMLHLLGHSRTPDSVVAVAITLHFGFWFWQFGRHLFFMGYGGPVAPAAGLSAALTWFYYTRRPRLSQT
jgi:hypothetical protein